MATQTRTIAAEQTETRTDTITRFDIHQRIQHVVLALSFIILVLTGLPLKFSDAGISQWWALLSVTY